MAINEWPHGDVPVRLRGRPSELRVRLGRAFLTHTEMTIRYTTTCLDLREWQDYVQSHPDSTVFHHRNWIELLVDQYGFGLHIPAIRAGGRIVAALPFLETRSVWGLGRLVSLPFTDCIRVLADSDEAASAFRASLDPAEYSQYEAVLIRTDKPSPSHSAPGYWVRHTLDTSCGFDQVADRFRTSAQQNVRRAESRQLRFECRDDADALQAFYKLHVQTRRRLGVPVQPRRFFERLYRWILRQNLGFVGLVLRDRRPIAAGVFLSYKSTLVYKYVASEPGALEDRPNDYLAYHAIRLAAERGFTTFDFGISQRSQEGLRRFKQKWGAVETEVVNEHLVGTARPLVEDSRMLRLVSVAIRNSPTVVCRVVGAIAYPYSQ